MRRRLYAIVLSYIAEEDDEGEDEGDGDENKDDRLRCRQRKHAGVPSQKDSTAARSALAEALASTFEMN